MNESTPEPIQWRSELTAILVTGIIAGLARLAYMNVYLSAAPLSLEPLNDAKAYWELGLRIYRDGWLLPHDGPFYQAPLYPYALAILHTLGIHRILSVLMLHSILGVINAVMCYLIVRRYVSLNTACIAAVTASLCHLPLFLESKLLAATLGITLFLAFILVILQWLSSRRIHWLIVSGLLFGLTVLCRPNQLFILPFMIVFLVWLDRRDRRIPLAAIAFLAAFTIAIMPSFLRNGLVGGDWVPFTGNAGVTLYMGTNPDAQGGLAPVAGLSDDIEDQRTQSVELASALAGRTLSPSEASDFWVKRTIQWVWKNPLAFIQLEWKKLAWALYHTPPAVNSSVHFEAIFIPWLRWLRWPTILLLWMGLLAIPLLWRSGDSKQFFLQALIAGYVLLSLVYYASDRFLAAMLPVFAAQAAIALQVWKESKRSASAHKRLAWAGWGLACLLIVMNPLLGWNQNSEIGIGWYNLGVQYEAKGRHQDAFAAYQEAYSYIPEHTSTMMNLGVAYARQGDLERSSALFERVLELAPDHPDALRNLEINQQRMSSQR